MTRTTALNYVPTYHTDTYPYINPEGERVSNAGKTIFITGGGYGIGATIAKSFARSSAANVILTGRTESALTKTASALEKEFPKTKFHTYAMDIVDGAAVTKVFSTVASSIGPIDVLVNNAGFLNEGAPLVSVDLKQWFKGFEVNVLGTAQVTQAFLKNKPAGREAVVLSTNTCIAHYGNFPNFSAYAASKLALLRIFDSFQLETPEVRYVQIHPGSVDTAMYEKSGFPKEGMTQVQLPADFMVWLASPEAAFLKGRLVWVQWDAEQLIAKGKRGEIEANDELAIGLRGFDGNMFTMEQI